MAEDAAQKTEPATPKRREDARRKGQVAQSRELQSVVVLAVALTTLLSPVGADIVDAMLRSVNAGLSAAASPPQSSADFHAVLLTSFTVVGWSLMPVFAAVVVFGAGAQVLQTGPLWSPEAVLPKLERVSLAKGFKRLFSIDRIFELGKALVKLAAVGAVGWAVLSGDIPVVVGLGRSDIASGIAVTVGLARELVLAVVVLLGLVAVMDVAYQRWRYEKQLRMTKQEIRDEMRQREGDPLLRGRAKAQHRELSRSRMITAVADADVVITNPTHFAVALAYDRGQMAAPKVLAKGRGHVASRIRAAAKHHGIPLVENPPLARLLYRTCETGREIPENLFEAVAEVLAFVFRIDPRRASGWGVAS